MGADKENQPDPSTCGTFSDAEQQAGKNIRLLQRVLLITSTFFLVEVVAGYLTRSLALLSDAGHMLSDMLALLISLYAAFLVRKAPTPKKSYGYYRTEVLAAFLNGLILFLMIGFVYYEALNRLFDPVEVHSEGVIIVGGAGLLVNLVAAWMLHGPKDLNIRGAYYHVIFDALGSAGALAAGILIYFTGIYVFDPLLSLFIGGLVLYSSWKLIRDSIHILMEFVPGHLDPEEVRKKVNDCNGVENVHDLHIWSIGSHSHALSAHIKIPNREDPNEIRGKVEELLRREFQLEHTTLQMEVHEDCSQAHE